jgi:hypothetical protein
MTLSLTRFDPDEEDVEKNFLRQRALSASRRAATRSTSSTDPASRWPV